MFDVTDARGIDTFVYQLSSTSCLPLVERPAAQSTSPLPRPRDETGPGGLPDLFDTSAPDCFAGYRVNFRALIENSLYVEPGSRLFASEYRYQVYDTAWKDVAALKQRGASWFDGCTAKASHQLEILDAGGERVLEDSEVVTGGCASSAPYSGVPAEDCARVADSANGVLQGVSDLFKVACDASAFITFRPDEVSASYEREGLTIGGSKNLNLCEIGKAGLESAAGVAEAVLVLAGHETPWHHVYNSCLEDPGWYLPRVYPPQSELPPIARNALLELFNAEEGQDVARCAGSHVSPVVQDMGDGISCAADVRFECSRTSTGCECNPTSVEGTMMCDER